MGVWVSGRVPARRGVGVIALAIGAVLGVACGGSSGDSTDDSTGSDDVATGDAAGGDASSQADPIGVEDVAGFESIDRRGELLAELGGPDAFVITVDEIGGEVVRFESWSYYEANSQIDLVDGEILWDVEIDDVPDGMLLPLAFSPMEFTMLSSVDEVLGVLEGVELESLGAAAAEFEIEGAELWVGEQLVLAFVDDALIYVETYALAADDQVVVP